MFILNLFINMVFAVSLDPECFLHVQNTYERRIEKLAEEGIIVKDSSGNWNPTLTTEQLYSNPRFRNFPAISLEQIKWCPKIQSVESSILFLQKVGFKPSTIDNYFKKLLFLSTNKDLVVLKDQVGPNNGRQNLKKWLELNPDKKNLVSHYAMAIYKDPADDKIKARAGSNYIGSHGENAIFTLPYHALFVDDNKKSCSDFEFYFPKVPKHPLKAIATLSEIPTMDIVFCELILTQDHSELKPASLNDSVITKNTPFMTLGVGTDKNSQKLELTIDASQECQSLVNTSEGLPYESGVIDTTTWRWAMGCDVSSGNSGDAVYHRTTGKLLGFVTTRSPYVYQILTADALKGQLDFQRLYMETSHFVPLSEIKKLSFLTLD